MAATSPRLNAQNHAAQPARAEKARKPIRRGGRHGDPAGELEATLGGQVKILRAGEACFFESRIPHRFGNAGTEMGVVVAAATPPSL
jgi:hypothetical protein